MVRLPRRRSAIGTKGKGQIVLSQAIGPKKEQFCARDRHDYGLARVRHEIVTT